MKELFKINQRAGWRLIDNKMVVFNCANQEIIILNETASRLWEILGNGGNLDQLVNWLIDEYFLNRKKAEQDVADFLKEMATAGVIELNNEIINIEEPGRENNIRGENILLAIEMKAIEKFIPFAVTFETTYTCNERCVHCYMDRNLPALLLSEIKRILREIAAEGCLFVSFTGGEFFTRRDALEIVEYAANLHFIMDILSNGTFVNREITEALVKYPVRRVQITLYGAKAETHDSITCLMGSFKKTLRGIKLLTEAGIKVEIAFPLMRQNFHECYAVKKLAKSMGCLISPSHIITARNNGSLDTFRLRINQKQLKEFLKDRNLSGLYAGRKAFQDHQLYFGFPDLLDAAPCYSGFNSCAITPSGKVLPCNQLLFEVGNLRKNTFSKIWHSSDGLSYLRGLTLRELKKCAGCALLNSCARCPGLALLEGGDLLGPSPENCRIATINSLLLERR